MRELFHHFAKACSDWMGAPGTFITSVVLVAGWLITGPYFDYSDTWQLTINTVTTVVTFLMVFLIQNTQNRDARALHLKLDELLRAMEQARTELVDLEEASDEELEKLQKQFRDLHERTRHDPSKQG